MLSRIRSEKLISIIRLKEQAAVQPAVDAVIAGGIRILEITTNTPGFSEEIEKARKKNPDILIGAGTVINAELAKEAITAGAQFLVTPNTVKDVVRLGRDDGIPVVMGAMTPTEVAMAVDFGADMIKLFPAGQLGIPYFKSLKGPFDSVSFIAVGGIDMENAREWFKAGVTGLGIGSSLVKSTVRADADFKEISVLAKKFKEIGNRAV